MGRLAPAAALLALLLLLLTPGPAGSQDRPGADAGSRPGADAGSRPGADAGSRPGASGARRSADFVTGDPRLVRLIRGILGRFTALRTPIEARLLTPEQNRPEALRTLGIPTQHVPISESTTVGGRHLVLYNAAFWAEADDAALTGNLAHELMHREWEELGLQGRVFDWTTSSLSFASLEHVIDYCVVGKGLHEELYRSKQYLAARHPAYYVRWDIAPNAYHLADVYTRASRFAMPGRSDAIPAAAVPPAIADDVARRLRAFSWHRE